MVDTVWMKCAKSDHENETDQHDRSAVCETRRQQQYWWIHNERQHKQEIPDNVDTSQSLNDAATCRLAHIVRQHWHNVHIPTDYRQVRYLLQCIHYQLKRYVQNISCLLSQNYVRENCSLKHQNILNFLYMQYGIKSCVTRNWYGCMFHQFLKTRFSFTNGSRRFTETDLKLVSVRQTDHPLNVRVITLTVAITLVTALHITKPNKHPWNKLIIGHCNDEITNNNSMHSTVVEIHSLVPILIQHHFSSNETFLNSKKGYKLVI